jgi:hypothetical protein
MRNRFGRLIAVLAAAAACLLLYAPPAGAGSQINPVPAKLTSVNPFVVPPVTGCNMHWGTEHGC